MQEVFYEESAMLESVGGAKTKYYVLKTMSIVSYVFAFFWFILAINAFPLEGNFLVNLLIAVVPLALFIASGIFVGKVKDGIYVDYDYTFVSGSIRISKVIKNVKRKKVINFDTENIEKIGRYESETYKKYLSMPNKKRLVLTANATPAENKDFYYIAANVGGQKYLLILECTEMLLSNILRFSGRNAFEDDFFNKKGKK